MMPRPYILNPKNPKGDAAFSAIGLGLLAAFSLT